MKIFIFWVSSPRYPGISELISCKALCRIHRSSCYYCYYGSLKITGKRACMTAHESLLGTCTVLPLHLGTTFGKILFLSLSLQPYISCCPNILQHIMNTGPETNFLSSALPGAQHSMGLIYFIKWETKLLCKKGMGESLEMFMLG